MKPKPAPNTLTPTILGPGIFRTGLEFLDRVLIAAVFHQFVFYINSVKTTTYGAPAA